MDAKQTLATLVLALSTATAFSQEQLCKQVKQPLTDKTLVQRYLFMTDGGATYNELHKIGKDNLIAQYSLSDQMTPTPNGMLIPGSRRPTSYVFKGKPWIDEKGDGINCNEKPYHAPGEIEANKNNS